MFCGRAAVDGTVRANEFHQTCRGNGDGKQAKLTSSNTGNNHGSFSAPKLWFLAADRPATGFFAVPNTAGRRG